MSYAVRTAGPEEGARLDTFLRLSGHTLLYQSSSYIALLESYFGLTATRLVAADAQHNIAAYFPLFVKSAEHGAVINSLPYYGSNGGIVVSPQLDAEERAEAAKAVHDEALRLSAEISAAAFTIISNPLDPEGDAWLRAHHPHRLVDERIGQLTPLPENTPGFEEKLVASFDDPRPRNIRKAVREGVTIRFSHTQADLDFLYEVHRENITAIGGIAKEKRFFDLIPQHFGGDGFRVYVAELNGQPIAALLLFYFNRTVEYFTPAVVEAFRGAQPSALIIYEAMLDAVRAGYRWWNWGGTWLSQGGVYDFKKKWGTEDLRYFYYTQLSGETLLSLSREQLLNAYPNFFVVPFSALKS